MDKKHVVIVGLRRSGTTVFLDTLKQDKRFTCFDEPFNIYVKDKFSQKLKGFESYYNHRELLKDKFSYISIQDEIKYTFSNKHVGYLKTLFSFENTCIDETRFHFRVEQLKKLYPDALIILLIRDPRAWITSQIRIERNWIDFNLPEKFFEFNKFNHWGCQLIAQELGLKGYAHKQLFDIWQIFNQRAIIDEPDLIIQFEKFCYDPEYYIKLIYSYLNLDYKKIFYHEIHKPNKPYDIHNSKWDEMLSGINRESEKYIYW